MSGGEPVGRVRAVWRYPVKSMRGEERARGEFTPSGVSGDRRFAVVDADTGKVASAKNPKKWGRLLDCSARFDECGGVRITLPDGCEVAGDKSVALSALLGRPVELRAAHAGGRIEVTWPAVPGLPLAGTATEEELPAGSFCDLAPVHLLSTSTLELLQRVHPTGVFDVARFRPNLVIETPGGCVEDGWVGRVLAVGTVLLRVTARTSRCVMTTLAQPGLPSDAGVLRAAVAANAAHAGVYAEVIQPGEVQEGDELRLSG
jgi:uncharacterized protein YcbX